MSRLERITQKLGETLQLQHLDVLDESSGHNVPEGAESHFKVVAVSDEFAQLSRINRHRTINELLEAEFTAGMHALAIHAYSPDEWRKRFGEAPMSPPCLGGESSNADAASG